MIFSYRYVQPPHWLPSGRLRGGARDFFRALDEVPGALIACVGKSRSAVGWLRFEAVEDQRTDRITLWAAGTWVEKDYRGAGIARELWDRVIDRYEPDYVIVQTASEGGRRLVGGLVGDYPAITFLVRA